jgi:hypothetical protein
MMNSEQKPARIGRRRVYYYLTAQISDVRRECQWTPQMRMSMGARGRLQSVRVVASCCILAREEAAASQKDVCRT